MPLDVDVLTRRGWLAFEQVEEGDETPGFNTETGHTQWTPISDLNVVDNAEVVETGNNRGWSVRATADHHWLARRFRTGEPYWATTDDRRQASWVASAPMSDGAGLHVTRDEAELLGWLMTDGSQWESSEGCSFNGCVNRSRAKGLCGSHRRQERQGKELHPLRGYPRGQLPDFSLFVWQTKDAGRRRLAEILGDRARDNGKGFRLPDVYARDLLERTGLTHIKNGNELLVLITRMTADQRKAMLTGVVGGDGTADGRRILQDDGPLLEAIATLAYYCGHRVRTEERTFTDGRKRNGVNMVGIAIAAARLHLATGPPSDRLHDGLVPDHRFGLMDRTLRWQPGSNRQLTHLARMRQSSPRRSGLTTAARVCAWVEGHDAHSGWS